MTDNTAKPQRPEHLRPRMAVSISRNNLSYAIYDPLPTDDEMQLRFVTIPLYHSNGLTIVQTLEEAVYANPVLLGDYGRVDIALDTPELILTPETTDTATAEQIADLFLPRDGKNVVIDTADSICNANVVLKLDAKFDAFIRRTFNTPRYHHLLPLAARCYCVDTTTPSPVVNIHVLPDDHFYIIIRRNQSLLLANAFKAVGDTDILYYALASLKAVGLDAAEVRVRTSGQPDRRQRITPLLNQTFDDVSPAALPSALLRHGTTAISIPFELSTLLLL